MKILHAYNHHRGLGGADNDWLRTIAVSQEHGIETATFSRDSRDLPPGLAGRAKAFISGIYARRAVSDFSRALRSFRPDVVHAHELFPLISPWILPKCTEAKIPVVFTCYDYRLTCPVAIHFQGGAICRRCMGGREYWAVLQNCRGSYPESLAYALRNAVSRRFGLVADNVSHYIVLTDFSRAWLVNDFGIPDKRISTSPCSIAVPETVADPAAGRYVGFAGRFVPEKGIEVLIEAARKAKLPVVLAGSAPTHPAIREGDDVKCIQTRSRDELAAFYRGARMLVIPSIWYETFGIVAAEAMSHGIPVVASRIGALRHTVQDGVSGLHFETQNADDLAATLTRLWNDPELCRTLGAGARRQVEEQYSKAGFIQRLTQVYEKAIADPIFADETR